jgi:hypothetical protein
LLAEAYIAAGQVGDGLETVAEALAAADATGERAVDAELYRLRAQLQRMQGRDSEAEADLHRALDVARSQEARWLELRAALSMSRLWRDQGKQGEAHRMLADIYGRFTEGFDTPVLQEAKALLGELADS